jgi:hypothetical protein
MISDTGTAAIGEIIQNALRFDMKNWSTNLTGGENLPEIVDQFFSLLDSRQIDYLLVGGIALLNYIEGRNTQDIDFIIARVDVSKMPEVTLIEENRDFARGRYKELQIDFLLTNNQLFEWVKTTYGRTIDVGERSIQISSVEGLVLLKLYALPSLYRQGKFDRVNLYEGDITQLLLAYSVDIERLLQELAQYVLPSDLEEIGQIIEDIQGRIRRFRATRERLADGDS